MSCSRPFLARIKTTFKDPLLVPVPCGHCPSCLSAKRKELAFRLMQDLNSPRCKDSLFVTLTYSDENLERDLVNEVTGEYYPLPSVNKYTIQCYLKRVRKLLHLSKGSKLMYYLTGEYGDITKRPHYHAIIYILSDEVQPLAISLKSALKSCWTLCDWSKLSETECFQSAKSVAAAMYVAKHQIKRCKGTYLQVPYFQLRSKGIGSEFFKNKKNVKFVSENGFLYDGQHHKIAVPRYYKDKLGLNTSYYDFTNIKNLNDSLKLQDAEEVHKFNVYCAQQYKKFPNITLEDIIHKYYNELLKRNEYVDKFFDVKYKKLSQSKKI